MRLRIIAFALLAAATPGCGNDSESAEPPTSTSLTTSTTSTTTEPSPPSSTAAPEPAQKVGAEPGQPNAAELQAFLATDPADDGPFYMINLIRFRDRARYPDGRETSLTGEEADAIYGEWMRSTKLPAIGAEIMYIAEVERDLSGGTSFDRVAVVRYPSRAAFAEMTADAEFQAMNVHKQAGVADTVVMAAQRRDIPPIPLLEDPPYPATDDDSAFAFVHVLDYRDTAEYQEGDADADTRSGRDAVDLYSSNAGRVALPLGVRSLAWFEIEATLIGPVNTWDEVRINWFPSHTAFEVLTSDVTWQSGAHHRAAGLRSTYAIQTLPVINEFG